ncbi:MAG TPA: FG-GAP-like repeat-containing protein [Opitutaceae bacterium]|jgi:hypothetical protein
MKPSHDRPSDEREPTDSISKVKVERMVPMRFGAKRGWRLKRMGTMRSTLIAAVGLSLALAGAGTARAADPAGEIVARPLAPHPHPRGSTMFVPLSSDDTGVKTTNRYDDPLMKGARYEEFETSSIGTGVAVGDYDGDGRPDILVVSKTEGTRLFHNLGNFKFEDVTEKAGLGETPAEAKIWKQGATFVDINNRGRLDIYICRTGAPNLLYINQGDGTFKEEAHAYGLDIDDSSVMASFCDYDRDGFLDVYIATNILDITAHPNGQRGYLLHNNGNGTFTNVTAAAGITDETQSHSATWWDFDNDGWPDLYVANDYGKPDRLYHNNRDGTFTDVLDQVAPHTAFSSMGADLGDVNNDGRIDLIVADMAATNHEKDQHSIADARGRGEEGEDPAVAPKYHRNALLLDTGVGRCLEGANLAGIAATDWTWSPRFEDLDNDGHLDLYVTNGFPRDPGVDVLKRSMAAETPAERIRIMYSSPPETERHLALKNLGHLQFKDLSTEWGLDQMGVSFGAAFGDFAGDGNLDLVYANYHRGVSFYRNDNDTGHRIEVFLKGTVSNRYGVGAVVHIVSALGLQTRQLVLARGYMSSSEPMLHFGLGADAVVRDLTVEWPSGLVQRFHGLPVDQRFTITEPAGPAQLSAPGAFPPPTPSYAEVSREAGLALPSRDENVDEVSGEKLLPIRLHRRGPAVAVGDVDGTGQDAIVIGGTTLDPLRILHRSAGSASPYTPADNAVFVPAGGSASVDDGPVLLFDARGQGRADLLVTKGGNSLPDGSPEYQPRLYYNDGQGHFQPAPDSALPALPLSMGAAAAADFTQSGHLGLFLGARLTPGAYPTAPRSALLINRGDGTFEDATDRLAPGLKQVGMVTGAVWTDVDGDGWPDLVLTLEWGQVKYFHNRRGQGFDDWTDQAGFAAAGSGWWTGVAAADFNGDGRPDFVVGNVGLNTQYHASPTEPAVQYYGDFGAPDGEPELIEGYYERGQLFPWRTRRDMVAVFPALGHRFATADDYSHATLADLFGQDKLDAAQRFAATEFRSGVFLSQPDGTYRFAPLPRIAQISPFQGIVAGDFDGDGQAGIYAVQNFYSPIPSVGRFDGGLSQLLRGDGHGHFTAVPPAESGLVVPADGKALVTLDLDHDGWPAFLATQNNGVTRVFRNARHGGNRMFAVRLHGPAGNPTGIGAAITVTRADGSRESGSVYAGSGYYSQSSPAAFFGSPSPSPAKSISVRWPDGKVTTQDVGSGSQLDLTEK